MNGGVATSNFPDNSQSTPLMTVIEENQASIFAADTSKPAIEPAGINYNNNFEKKEKGNLSSMDYQIEVENPFKQQQEAAFSFSQDQSTVKPNPQYSPKPEATNFHKSSSSAEEQKYQDQGFSTGSEQSGRENNQKYLQDKSFPVPCLQDQYSPSSQPNYKTSEGFTDNSYSNKMFNASDEYPNPQQLFTTSASTDSLFKSKEQNFTSTPVNELYPAPAVKNQLFNATGHVEQIYKTPAEQLYTSSTSSDQVYKASEPTTSVDQLFTPQTPNKEMYNSSEPVYKSPPPPDQIYTTTPPAKQYYSNHSPTEQIFNSPAPTEQVYSSPAEAAYASPAPAEQIYASQAPMEQKYPSGAPNDHILSNPVPAEQSYSSAVVTELAYPSQTSSEQIFSSHNPAEQMFNTQVKNGSMYDSQAPAEQSYSSPASAEHVYQSPGPIYDSPAPAEQSYSSPTAAEHAYQSPAQVEQIYNASGAGEQIFKSSAAPSEQIFTPSSVAQSLSAPAEQFTASESGEQYATNNGGLAHFGVPTQEQYNLQTEQQYPSKPIQETFNNLSAQGQFAAFMNEKQYAATETAEQNTNANVQKQFSSNPAQDQYSGTDKYASADQFKPVEQYSASSVEQMASKEPFSNGSALGEQFSSQHEFHSLQQQQSTAADKSGFRETQNQCSSFQSSQPSKMDTFESNLDSIVMDKPTAVVAMDYEITPSSYSKTGTEESRLAMYDDACSAPIQGDPLLSETSVVIDVQKDIENACVENQHGSGILDQSWNTAGSSDLQDWS